MTTDAPTWAVEPRPMPFPDWLREAATFHDAEAEILERRPARYARMGFSGLVCGAGPRLAWLNREIASLCRQLADEAEMTRSGSPEALEDARFRACFEDDVIMDEPIDPDARRPHPMACMGPGRRPAPMLSASRSRVDDPIDIPF